MARYAINTDVGSDRSKNEIEHTLTRYGARKFAYGWSGDNAVVQFEMRDRRIKFVLPLPKSSDLDIRNTSTGRSRKANQINLELERARRQRWRALLLVIKAKLESVETGVEVFEDAFLAQITLPNGRTVGDMTRVGIELAYTNGQMPVFPLLGAGDKEE